jgi:dolichol-phosphate mannosyltransferase
VNIVIVIPTYNERANIELLIQALEDQFSFLDHTLAILVVDDNSPDGTGDCVRGLRQTYDNVHVLSGAKKGLGAAYIRGMRYALENLSADAVIEMDADFSHQPADVPRLVTGLEAGKDFIIGSRYVKGGKIPDNWGWWRKTLSRWGNIFARHLAGLYRVRDCTAGFRAIRASILRQINFDALKVQGYAFQIALLNQAMLLKATIEEIPVEFIDRERGETKLGLADIVEFFLNVWWIRFQASRTFLKFALVGLSGALVNLLCFMLLMRLGINKFVASPLAIELSILNNFLWNNYWTFKPRNSEDSLWFKGLKFKSVSLLALTISYTTFLLSSLAFPEVQPVILQGAAIIPAGLVNYFLNSYWTFRDQPQTQGQQARTGGRSEGAYGELFPRVCGQGGAGTSDRGNP